jgi:hypothetical protein
VTQFPNLVQAALLFDRPNPIDLDTLIESFMEAGTKLGRRYNRVEAKPGAFHRLFGGNVMITVEYIGSPANSQNFNAALGTTFTQMTNPKARELIAQHRSHILVNVHHGVMPPTPEITSVLEKMGVSQSLRSGQSRDDFRERLSLCGSLARVVNTAGRASLVHWTTSDQLMTGDVFAELVKGGVPGLLHIHPLLWPGGKSADGRNQITITTFGAKYFVGREIHFAANPLPWTDTLGLILTFLGIATMKKGYVIPDDDTFGDDDRSLSCRVRHIPEGAKSGNFDGPLYRLDLLFARKHGFVSPGYKAPGRTFDDRTVPADILADLGRERFPVVEDMRFKRQMVERIGGRLEVSEKLPPYDPMNSPPAFGRKKPQSDF